MLKCTPEEDKNPDQIYDYPITEPNIIQGADAIELHGKKHKTVETTEY